MIGLRIPRIPRAARVPQFPQIMEEIDEDAEPEEVMPRRRAPHNRDDENNRTKLAEKHNAPFSGDYNNIVQYSFSMTYLGDFIERILTARNINIPDNIYEIDRILELFVQEVFYDFFPAFGNGWDAEKFLAARGYVAVGPVPELDDHIHRQAKFAQLWGGKNVVVWYEFEKVLYSVLYHEITADMVANSSKFAEVLDKYRAWDERLLAKC